jgi:hypothetical protein
MQVHQHPSGLLLGIIGSSHVSFGCGAAGRCARVLANADFGVGSPTGSGASDRVRSVLLNPTCADTDRSLLRPGFPLTALQLRYAAAAGDGGPAVTGGHTPSDSAEAFAMGQVGWE